MDNKTISIGNLKQAWIDPATMDSYNFFKSQRDNLLEGLLKIDRDGAELLNWHNLSDKNIQLKKNWFSGFRPSSWGNHKGSGFGIAFWFYYRYEKKIDLEFLRVTIGCESPLKNKCKKNFKESIADNVNLNNISLAGYDLYPTAGIQKGKVLVQKMYPLNNNAVNLFLSDYHNMEDFIEIISRTIYEFYKNDCFKVDIFWNS